MIVVVVGVVHEVVVRIVVVGVKLVIVVVLFPTEMKILDKKNPKTIQM